MNPDLPGPQHLSIEGPAVAIWGQYLSYVAKSDNAMDRYVWTLNGEKIAETFIPTLYFQASAYQPGFYTLGMTAWKDGYPYSSYQSLRIARDGAGIQ
jgi:hypothetical protein